MRRWTSRFVAIAMLAWVGVWILAAPSTASDNAYAEVRERMVAEQIASNRHGFSVRDPRVLEAMRTVPRHEFVLPGSEPLAYTDQPLPIAAGQTISQPFIVALMTELADLKPGERVLEVGTGSGYQAAVRSEITDDVYSIEIIEELAQRARDTLERLGYAVKVALGDGYLGWAEAAPFDAISVTAAAPTPGSRRRGRP
jgi:protein-L-isoaspartate(D-aspartate) O-methyltransferase